MRIGFFAVSAAVLVLVPALSADAQKGAGEPTVAKTLILENKVIHLRDDNLRPSWAAGKGRVSARVGGEATRQVRADVVVAGGTADRPDSGAWPMSGTFRPPEPDLGVQPAVYADRLPAKRFLISIPRRG